MRAQPRHSRFSHKVVAHPGPTRLELYRERCQDEDGNGYAVIVYRPFPELDVIRYELEDGTPVRFIDDCLFEIEPTGRTISRCEL